MTASSSRAAIALAADLCLCWGVDEEEIRSVASGNLNALIRDGVQWPSGDEEGSLALEGDAPSDTDESTEIHDALWGPEARGHGRFSIALSAAYVVWWLVIRQCAEGDRTGKA